MDNQPDTMRSQRAERLHAYLEADPDNLPLLGELADLYLHAGAPDRARPFVERLLALCGDPQARFRQAVLLFQEHRFADSQEVTQHLLDAGIDHPAVRYQHALVLSHLERFEEAEALLASLVAEGHEIAELPHLYIRTLHHSGRVDEAIEYAAARVASVPGDSTAAGMLGLLYLDDDRLEDATTAAERALRDAPHNPDALVTLGYVTLAKGNGGGAEEYFASALASEPANGRAHLGRALCAMLVGDLTQGTADLVKAVQCMPRHLGSWNALAWTQLLNGDIDAAEKTLHECLRVDRSFGETYGALAVVAAHRGEWELASKLADKAARLQPDGFAGRFAKSLVWSRQGRKDRADALVKTMLKSLVLPGGDSLDDMVRRFTGTPTPTEADPPRPAPAVRHPGTRTLH